MSVRARALSCWESRESKGERVVDILPERPNRKLPPQSFVFPAAPSGKPVFMLSEKYLLHEFSKPEYRVKVAKKQALRKEQFPSQAEKR